jgi:hypothetical protein
MMHREMGCTRDEFLRSLPAAVRHAPLLIDGNRIAFSTHGGRVEITLAERPARRLGALALPVLAVSFAFCGLEDRAREDFLVYFDLCTRRGGG